VSASDGDDDLHPRQSVPGVIARSQIAFDSDWLPRQGLLTSSRDPGGPVHPSAIWPYTSKPNSSFCMHRVLFLCTGNYYRSRFAEHLFNHRARGAGLEWEASSRALAIERGKDNVGPMSIHAIEALAERGVRVSTERPPLPCTIEDLVSADLAIAVKEAEHRPLLSERFAGWERRVTYWHVHDIDGETPANTLAEIDRHVEKLIASLGG
jgi:protein-tyrosine-phosphatase